VSFPVTVLHTFLPDALGGMDAAYLWRFAAQNANRVVQKLQFLNNFR
jgi:hypothetical protein